MLRKENNLKDLADVYNSIAQLFKTNKNTDSSIYYLQQSLNITHSNRFAKEAMEAFIQLAEVYENINNDSSLRYYKQAMIAKDSLFSREKQY